MKKNSSDHPRNNDNDRFQLRSGPAPTAEILSTHATREEADNALVARKEEIATKHAEVATVPPEPVIVDMGVRPPVTEATEAIEAKKTAQQKEEDRARREPATANR